MCIHAAPESLAFKYFFYCMLARYYTAFLLILCTYINIKNCSIDASAASNFVNSFFR